MLTQPAAEDDRISDFELKLMDIDSEHLGIPDTEYKTIITLQSGEFKRIVNELSVMGDTIKIGCSKEGVKFSVAGDIGKGCITLRPSENADDEKKRVKISQAENVNLEFATRYLKSFTQAAGLSETVTLNMSTDAPLMVEYQLDGGLGFIRYYLAPKIADVSSLGARGGCFANSMLCRSKQLAALYAGDPLYFVCRSPRCVCSNKLSSKNEKTVLCTLEQRQQTLRR